MSINSARDFRKEIKKHADRFYVIHYSCQSLNDDNEGLSPRITSIAVSFLGNSQVVSFSTHAVAEELGISRDDVPDKLDDIERLLLSKFYDFVRDKRDKYWVHWNMRSLTFGFEHIEHRANVLRLNNVPVIPIERRINLSDMLGSWYGPDYVADPKMSSLMDLNGGIHREFLTGLEEVEAFKSKEFIKLHKSTLSKVGFFDKVLRKWIKGELRTKANSFWVWIDRTFESRTAKLVAFLGTLASLVSVPLSLILWVFS